MNHNILEFKNFLNPQECWQLIKYHQLHVHEPAPDYADPSGLWPADRVLVCDKLKSGYVRTVIESAHYRMSAICSRLYDEECVYPEHSNLVYWGAGMKLPPHADNVFIHEPATPHYCAQRDYSVVVYLNEEFEGGYTYFPQYEYDVIPETGKLLMFPSGDEYVHGVSEVISGERYTLAVWFSKERTFLFKMNSI